MRFSSNFDQKDLEKPFLLGWKREIVERVNSVKKCSDTYYYSPAGKKLRSVPEVIKYLLSVNDDSGLAAQNFNFSNHFIYHEPEEFYRGKSTTPNTSSHALSPIKNEPIYQNYESKYTGNTSNEINNIIKTELGLITTHPILKKKSSKKRLTNLKTKLSCKNKGLRIIISKKDPIKRNCAKRNKIGSKGIKLESYKIDEQQSKIKNPEIILKSPKINKKFKSHDIARDRTDLCSLNCQNLEGILPSLNCDFCMCSFHPECVNAFGITNNFICQSCRDHQNGPARVNEHSSIPFRRILPKSSKRIKSINEEIPISQCSQGLKANGSIDGVGGSGRILSIPLNSLDQRLDLTSNLNITIDGNRFTIAPKYIIDSNQVVQIFIPA